MRVARPAFWRSMARTMSTAHSLHFSVAGHSTCRGTASTHILCVPQTQQHPSMTLVLVTCTEYLSGLSSRCLRCDALHHKCTPCNHRGCVPSLLWNMALIIPQHACEASTLPTLTRVLPAVCCPAAPDRGGAASQDAVHQVPVGNIPPAHAADAQRTQPRGRGEVQGSLTRRHLAGTHPPPPPTALRQARIPPSVALAAVVLGLCVAVTVMRHGHASDGVDLDPHLCLAARDGCSGVSAVDR